VIADDGPALKIDPRIEGIVRIKIEEAVGNFEPAEGQCGFDILHSHHALQLRMQPGAGQLEVGDRTARGQIPADEDGIFCFNCNIEVPLAKWGLWEGSIREGRLLLGPWSGRPAD